MRGMAHHRPLVSRQERPHASSQPEGAVGRGRQASRPPPLRADRNRAPPAIRVLARQAPDKTAMVVILVHGMGRTPLSMRRLRRRLRRAGHAAFLFGYVPALETLDHAAARLATLIGRSAGATDYALVGHSLGTVVIRAALARPGVRAPAACFFLAPPMRACRAARFFSRFALYRLLTGQMGQRLADDAFMAALPLPAAPTRLYVGTGGPRAAWLPHGLAANDGILSVTEARGGFAGVVVEVPCLHTFIMNARPVVEDMLRTLANDRLESGA